MAYSIAEVDSLLSKLQKAAGPLFQMRTDVNQIPKSSGRDLVLNKRRGREIIGLANSDRQRAAAVERVSVFFGCGTERASRFYDLADQLHTLNPVGSWVLESRDSPELVMLDVDAPQAHPLLDDVLWDMKETLSSIAQIRVVNFVEGHANGKMKRRVFLRFVDVDGREAAAIDTSMFSVHINAALIGGTDHRERNNLRSRLWAEQLGVELSRLPGVFHDLALLTVTLATRVVILRPIQTTVD